MKLQSEQGPRRVRGARVPVLERLRLVLPDLHPVSPSAGSWRSPLGPASYRLAPDGSGFWTVFSGTGFSPGGLEAAPDSNRRLLLSAGRWPWPLKAIRHRPGGSLGWSAEVHLSGLPGEDEELARLVARIGELAPGLQVPFPRVEPHPPGDWVDLLRDALGGAVTSSGAGFRLSVPDGPPLALDGLDGVDGGLRIRSVLVRSAGPLSPLSLDALLDLLAIANQRHPGCRASVVVSEESREVEEIVVESRVPWARFPAALESRVSSVLAARRALAEPCRFLCLAPPLGERYAEWLLGMDGEFNIGFVSRE